jgi:hypothetical protein
MSNPIINTQNDLETYSNLEFVSPLATQSDTISMLQKEFISSILTRIFWTNYLEILSQANSQRKDIEVVGLPIMKPN